MPMISILFLSVTLFNQTPLLIESFTDEQFPPVGWDTSYSAQMNAWYRYNYTGTPGPDSFQARVRVYDANDTLRTGYSVLKTLVLDLSTAVGSESLYFWYRFSQETSNLGPFDTMYIDITNDGVNWNNLLKIKQGDDTNVWQIAHLDLSPYDSYSSAHIRFHYEDRPNGQLGTWNCNFWLDSVMWI